MRANNATTCEQRAAELLVLRDLIEALLLAMRVAKEVKVFKSFAGYLHAVEQVGSVATGRSVTFVAQRGESGGALMRRVPMARWVAGGARQAARERPV